MVLIRRYALGTGQRQCKDLLKENPELCDDIEMKVREELAAQANKPTE